MSEPSAAMTTNESGCTPNVGGSSAASCKAILPLVPEPMNRPPAAGEDRSNAFSRYCEQWRDLLHHGEHMMLFLIHQCDDGSSGQLAKSPRGGVPLLCARQ
jgi:hypothetical protein